MGSHVLNSSFYPPYEIEFQIHLKMCKLNSRSEFIFSIFILMERWVGENRIWKVIAAKSHQTNIMRLQNCIQFRHESKKTSTFFFYNKLPIHLVYSVVSFEATYLFVKNFGFWFGRHSLLYHVYLNLLNINCMYYVMHMLIK